MGEAGLEAVLCQPLLLRSTGKDRSWYGISRLPADRAPQNCCCKPCEGSLENCKRMYVLFERTNKNGGLAVADANGTRTELDSSFDGGWGSYAHNTLVFSAREAQAVTLTITPQLEETREFALLAVMLS